MKIELSVYDYEFVINLFEKYYRLEDTITQMIRTSSVHPDSEEYVVCEITIFDLGELVGELSYEANHNRKKRISAQACEVADSLESQLYWEKCG